MSRHFASSAKSLTRSGPSPLTESYVGGVCVESFLRGSKSDGQGAPADEPFSVARMTPGDLIGRAGGVIYFSGLTAPLDHQLKQNIVDACVNNDPQIPLVVGWYRGHAKSAGKTQDVTVDGMMTDAAATLAHSDYGMRGPLDIHAHSAGSLVGLRLAIDIENTDPGRIHRVVCYALPADYEKDYFDGLCTKPVNRERWEKEARVWSPATPGFFQDRAFAHRLTELAAEIVALQPKFPIVLIGSAKDPIGKLNHMKEFARAIGDNARIIECNSASHTMGDPAVGRVTVELISGLAKDPAYMDSLRAAVAKQGADTDGSRDRERFAVIVGGMRGAAVAQQHPRQ